ncbi:MAG: TRAP transporter small permease [Desulfovibrionaceae bacterium]
MKVLAAVCLFGMAVVTGIDVMGRGAMNAPLFGSEEMVSILAVLAVGFSLPYAHSQGSHIGVEVLYQRLPRRARQWLMLATDLAAAGLFGVVAWQMIDYGFSMRASGMVSMNLALPVYWVVWALGFCLAVFALGLAKSGLQSLSKDFR